MDWIGYAISGVFALAVAWIEAVAARERKKTEAERKADLERTERRAEQRAEESRLSMGFMNANCSLSVVTAKAVTHQHVNGDVEEAMKAAQDAQAAYRAFCDRLAAQQVAKSN